MSTPTIDYDKLATQHGGTPVVDYDALAAQHGGTAVEQPQSARAQQSQPNPEGFWESLGHTFGIGKEEAQALHDRYSQHPVQEILKQAVGPLPDLIESAVQGGKRIATTTGKAVSDVRAGNYNAAAADAMEAVPFVGPAIKRGAEQLGPDESINRGELGTAVGTALQTAPMVLGAADSVVPNRPIVPTPPNPVTALVNKIRYPLGDMVVKPRGTVPAESASPAELKAYADENQIPLNAAQATQHSLPLNFQSVGERATVGGTPVKQQIKAGQAAVIGHAHDLMNSFSPDTLDTASAGTKIQQNIAEALEREKQASEQAYSQIDNSANGVKVDMKPLKEEAASLLKDSNFIRQNVSKLDPKRASDVVQAIGNLPDTATFTQAQQLRSALLDEARHPDIVISQQGQGWIKRLSGLTDRQMDAAARASSPELMSQFRAANAHWEGMQEAFNNPRSPLYQALQETDPNKVPQKFLAKGQLGGSPYNAELLDRYGIDKGPIKWALMGDMISKDFGLYQGGKNLAGYSDPFLESMFTPAELESIHKTGAISRSLRANTNPSGTAGVESAISDVENPLKAAPKTAAAWLTNKPWFNDWLMKNPPPDSSDLMAFSKWLNQRRTVLSQGASSLAAGGNASDQPHEKQ